MNFQKRYVFALGLTALLSAAMPVGAQQPAEFAKALPNEISDWAKAVQTANVTLD